MASLDDRETVSRWHFFQTGCWVGSSRGLWIIGNTTTYNPSLLGLLAVGTCAASTLHHSLRPISNTIPEVLSTRRQKSFSKDWPRMLSKDTGGQPYLIRWSRTALDNSSCHLFAAERVEHDPFQPPTDPLLHENLHLLP